MPGKTKALINRFNEVEKGDFPDFSSCSRPLDMALWVLWVAKDKLGESKLTGEEIASIVVKTQEISIPENSIINSLNRAKDKVHRYHEEGDTYFEVMKPGKDYLMSLKPQDILEVIYFEPGQKYSSKRLLATGVLKSLTGELRFVDPYCGERTLDVIKDLKARPVKFLTRLGNLTNVNVKNRFLRELEDFKTENADIEFRDYPNTDLHDRYIISPDKVVLIGHSIKDLGAKESFAIVLNQASSQNIYEALSENFDRRWKESTTL